MSAPLVEPLIRAAAEHTRELLPELQFLRVGGVLVVDIGVPITGVRLDLRTGEPLDLHAVRLTGVEQQPRDPSIEVSIWRRRRRVAADQVLAAQPGNPPTLRTASGPHCWAEIVWPTPVCPTSVELSHAVPDHGHRGRAMVVSVRDSETGSWRVVHDGAERVRAAREAVTARVADQIDPQWPDADQIVPLVQVAFSVATGEYREARAAIETLLKRGLSQDRLAALRAVVNPLVLAERQREWTAHGAARTFRFWSEQEKVDYLAQAATLCTDLTTMTPRVCFGFGAALAVVRDEDLIPHDDDLDLVIAFGSDVADSLAQALTVLETGLREMGYEVTGDFFAHRKVGRPGHKKIDVFVGVFGEPRRWPRSSRRAKAEIAWYPGPRGSLTVGQVFPVSYREILGVRVPLPRDPEFYLQTQYGEDWRVPDPQFRHQWGRGRYSDVAAPATPSL